MSAVAKQAKAEATKQSIVPVRRDGLLRGACHRAALRADPLARNDGGIRTMQAQSNFLNRINAILPVQSARSSAGAVPVILRS